MSQTRLLAACALLAVVIGAYVARASRDMRDFEVYRVVGARAAAAEPLYRAGDEHYQFKYLPAFAVLAIPLSLLPLPVAKGVWFFGSVILLIAFLGLSVRLLPEKRRPASWLIAITMLVLAKFYVRELDMGQVNLLFGVTATAALLAMRTGRGGLAAALLVLTTAVKPYGAVLLPLLLVRRQKATTAAAGIGVLLLLLLPAPLYGLRATIGLSEDWWHVVTETTGPNLLNPDNVSLASMYAKWLGVGGVSAALAAASTLALLGGVVVLVRRRRSVPFPEGLEGSLVLLLIPLLSPQGWDYVLLIGTPAVVYLANYWEALPRLWRGLTVIAGLTIGLSLFDLMGRAAYAAFMGAAVISVCVLVLAAALGLLRLRAIA